MNCARVIAAAGTRGLSALEQLVYVLIVAWADGLMCRTSIQAIAHHLNRDGQRPTILRALKALATKGLIAIERGEDGRNCYRLLDTAVLAPEQHRGVSRRATPVSARATEVLAPEQHPLVSEGATPNGGNPPIPEPSPRARVDSSSSSKEEGKKGRKNEELKLFDEPKLVIADSGEISEQHRLFTEGLPILINLTRRPPDACRAMLGRLRKQARDDCGKVLHSLRRASDLKPADPMGWLMASVAGNSTSPGGQVSQFPTRYPPRDQDPLMGMVRL